MVASLLVALAASVTAGAGSTTFDVRDFGATGSKEQDARGAIQRAIDACAAAGGGSVLLPPGEYTSGTLELRSRVRLLVAHGATLFSAKGKAAFPADALL